MIKITIRLLTPNNGSNVRYLKDHRTSQNFILHLAEIYIPVSYKSCDINLYI